MTYKPSHAFTSPRTGCSHTITTFLEQYYYSSRPGQHGSQVAFLDLASRDHENHGFGNAGAEIKAWLLGHAAILALGFSTCLVISATLAIGLQHPHAGYAAFFDQTRS